MFVVGSKLCALRFKCFVNWENKKNYISESMDQPDKAKMTTVTSSTLHLIALNGATKSLFRLLKTCCYQPERYQ